jgi:hypothetical protein
VRCKPACEHSRKHLGRGEDQPGGNDDDGASAHGEDGPQQLHQRQITRANSTWERNQQESDRPRDGPRSYSDVCGLSWLGTEGNR